MRKDNNRVGTYKAKTHLSELLKKVEAGEETVITKHGVPVAKLVGSANELYPEGKMVLIESTRNCDGRQTT